MFKLISNIQDILLQKKDKALNNLGYKNLRFHSRPTELEQVLSFNYFIIDTPPSNNSITTKKELDEVIRLSNSRNQDTEQTILLIDKDPLVLYKAFLKTKNLVFPKEKFDTMYHLLYNIIMDIKLYYNRPRPNQISEFYSIDINVLHTDTHATPSYPSGHVAYAKLAELVIKETYPDLDGQIEKLTEKVGYARIKQGIHFKSDIDASLVLVPSIYNELKKYYERESE